MSTGKLHVPVEGTVWARTYARCRCSRAQALQCAYVGAQPEGSLSPEQLTQLAHAVRLAHLTPYFLAKVAPRVGWLCAEGRLEAVEGVAYIRMGGLARGGTPAAWLPSAPARTGAVEPASRPVEWELPLAQLQPLVEGVAAGGSIRKLYSGGKSAQELESPCTTAAFGLGWGLMLRVAPVDDSSTARPRAVKLGLFVMPHFKHVPRPPETAKLRWVVPGGICWCWWPAGGCYSDGSWPSLRPPGGWTPGLLRCFFGTFCKETRSFGVGWSSCSRWGLGGYGWNNKKIQTMDQFRLWTSPFNVFEQPVQRFERQHGVRTLAPAQPNHPRFGRVEFGRCCHPAKMHAIIPCAWFRREPLVLAHCG
jgi:hypothetical protein